MKTSQFVSRVKQIGVNEIRRSKENPRGTIERDEAFERLAASINRVGILVPVVVSELRRPAAHIKYELVDGERRYLAAKELALETIPAHIVKRTGAPAEARRLMFHLHMTREQWEPIAQCRSLVAAYPELAKGLKFSEKPAWVKRLADETNMPTVTARDRIHVLAWPEALKSDIFEFDEREPSKNIYSYVLAIEASIVVPSLDAFPTFFNGSRPVEPVANEVRGALLKKTINGLETGLVRSREQIRSVAPIFTRGLRGPKKRVALSVFKDLVRRDDYLFEDARAEITTRLPELLEEKPPKPQRVIAAITSLARMLDKYEPRFITESARGEKTKKKLRLQLLASLRELERAVVALRSKF